MWPSSSNRILYTLGVCGKPKLCSYLIFDNQNDSNHEKNTQFCTPQLHAFSMHLLGIKTLLLAVYDPDSYIRTDNLTSWYICMKTKQSKNTLLCYRKLPTIISVAQWTENF